MSNEHREKAVEALARRYERAQPTAYTTSKGYRDEAHRMLAAAEPHLQRLYFEQFREAVWTRLESAGWSSGEDIPTDAIEAAFAEAQEIMEEGDRG